MSKINNLFIGNEENYQNIINSFQSNTLSNSNIIYGDRGIGKSTFVYHFVFNIFDYLSENDNSINSFNHRLHIQNKTHPNFYIIDKLVNEKTNKLNNHIIIDQIRNLENFINKSSLIKLPKIILIDNADYLNQNSSNALLKLLEEPKKDNYFFLISHQISSLIPTIRSRCIKFLFKKLKYTEFINIINYTNPNIEESNLSFLYDITNGSPGLSLEFYDNELYSDFFSIIELYKNEVKLNSKLTDFSDYISKKGNEQFNFFLLIFKFILINLIKINFGLNLKNKFKSNILNSLLEISNIISLDKCMETLEYINNNQNNVNVYNLDKKLFILNLFSSTYSNNE